MTSNRSRPPVAALLALALSVLSGASSARAELVTFEFGGGSGQSAFTGTFSYDTGALDLAADPTHGVYEATAAMPMSFSLTSAQGSLSVLSTNGGISLRDGPVTDTFIITLSGPSASSFYLGLSDSSATVFSSDLLPTDLDLGRFGNAGLSLVGPGGSFTVAGDLTYLRLRAVPEPASLALLGCGGLGLLGYARRKARATA